MLETLIDLTYRGISLGKRIKLTQVRPTTGFVELAAPMPVGTEISVTSDDGVAFGATVTWVHEQVAGADRAAGMVVSPRLFGDAATWWQTRVTLPEDDAVRPMLPRSRPVTVRPRSHTQPSPMAMGAPQSSPSIVADLHARVTAGKPAASEQRTTVMSVIEHEQLAQRTTVMSVIEQEQAAHRAVEPAEPEDAATTVTMDAVAPDETGDDPAREPS